MNKFKNIKGFSADKLKAELEAKGFQVLEIPRLQKESSLNEINKFVHNVSEALTSEIPSLVLSNYNTKSKEHPCGELVEIYTFSQTLQAISYTIAKSLVNENFPEDKFAIICDKILIYICSLYQAFAHHVGTMEDNRNNSGDKTCLKDLKDIINDAIEKTDKEKYDA